MSTAPSNVDANFTIVELLAHAVSKCEYGFSGVPSLLKRVIKEECWKHYVVAATGQEVTHEHFADFVTAQWPKGLGVDPHLLERLCADDKPVADAIGTEGLFRTTQQEAGHITTREYATIEQAYDHFNARLFEGALPGALITYQRKRGARGHFSEGRFEARDEARTTDEIALNPSGFRGRTDREILSTLAHEMTHQWQHCHGKPSRPGYHNAQWADRMVAIGLHPSSTGEPGGKQTGQRVTHYIVTGGPFDVATAELLGAGTQLMWQSPPEKPKERKTRESKVKYNCPGCALNAWAKPDAPLICGSCSTEMLPKGAA